MKPNFQYEKKLHKQGYGLVIGLDEAGRGPLAGPVTAGAVAVPEFLIFNLKFLKSFKDVNDSKLLTKEKREEIFDILTNHPDVLWGVGVVSEKVIDKINILEATKLAMQKAVNDLNSRLLPACRQAGVVATPRNDGEKNAFLLIDGNFKINSEYMQQSIIKGDQKVFSISAASIIAKVTRDRLMQKAHEKYPQYGFYNHKGYGTSEHLFALQKYGPCPLHRKTFYPISKVIHS